MRPRRSEEDPGLRAVVTRARPMRYRRGADPSQDRPAHVRAGSGVTWWRGHLAVVQDDTAIVALVDPRDALADALPLPMPDGVRQFGEHLGNKKRKLDHECVFAVGDTLVALGSGSKKARFRILRCAGVGAPELIDGTRLYRALLEREDFSGSALNVEGACVVDGALRLFQRGNGGDGAVNATGDIDLDAFMRWLDAPEEEPPPLRDVTRWELDAIGGVRLCFTDACARPDGAVLYLAAAEDSADTYNDGPVGASVLGLIPRAGPARYARLCGVDGSPLAVKVEGITLDHDDPHRAWVVVDADDVTVPSSLLEVTLTGI
jgi:hypothetical protein